MKKQNILLYLFEFIAYLAVIEIHCPFPGKIGTALTAISRFAVPFFFMVTGFFMFSDDYETSNLECIKDYEDKLKHKISKSFIVFIMSYMFYEVCCSFLNNASIASFIGKFTVSNVIMLVCFNQSPLLDNGFHLWFLMALVYVYIAFYCFHDYFYRFKRFLCLIWAILFFTLEFMYVNVDFLFLGYAYKGIFFIVNGLVEGIFCVLLGINLRCLLKQNSVFIENIEKMLLLKFFVLSFLFLLIASILERLLLGNRWDIFVSSILLAVLLVSFSHANMNKNIIKIPNIVTNYIPELVKVYGIYIYIT